MFFILVSSVLWQGDNGYEQGPYFARLRNYLLDTADKFSTQPNFDRQLPDPFRELPD